MQQSRYNRTVDQIPVNDHHYYLVETSREFNGAIYLIYNCRLSGWLCEVSANHSLYPRGAIEATADEMLIDDNPQLKYDSQTKQVYLLTEEGKRVSIEAK